MRLSRLLVIFGCSTMFTFFAVFPPHGEPFGTPIRSKYHPSASIGEGANQPRKEERGADPRALWLASAARGPDGCPPGRRRTSGWSPRDRSQKVVQGGRLTMMMLGPCWPPRP